MAGRPNKAEFARANGVSPNSFRRVTAGRRRAGDDPIPIAVEMRARVTETDDGATASVTSEFIKTLDELLDACQIDRSLWEVEKSTVHTFPAYRRDEQKDLAWTDGKMSGHVRDDGELTIVTMYSVTAHLRRRADAPYEGAMELLIDRLRKKSAAPPRSRKYEPGDHLLVPALYDVHFGRLGVDGGYHPDQTAAEFRAAGETMIAKLSAMRVPIERVLLPVGNDLLNADNKTGTTTKGTWQQMSAAQETVVDAACSSYIDFIERLIEVAPVDVVLIEGNHDRYSTYWLGKVLEARFAMHSYSKYVTVNNAPLPRKYYQYGSNLIGMEHGDQVKAERLALTMATEAPGMWADTRYRTFLRGHFHKAQEMLIPTDTAQGVSVVTFPAFCPSNAWEVLLGYVGGRRAAEARLFHREHGPAGNFPIFIDELDLSDASDSAAA